MRLQKLPAPDESEKILEDAIYKAAEFGYNDDSGEIDQGHMFGSFIGDLFPLSKSRINSKIWSPGSVFSSSTIKLNGIDIDDPELAEKIKEYLKKKEAEIDDDDNGDDDEENEDD